MTGSAAATSRPRLVDTANFLLATRDSGYRSTAYAVAEFVDNSLQAGATSVAIDLLAGDEKTFPIELLVVDDGIGMDAATLAPPLLSGGQVGSMTGPHSGVTEWDCQTVH
jgi:Histidine kinase-, DNA gyrase B-, and HSP90-like ATPase